jgi:hypothetical protein
MLQRMGQCSALHCVRALALREMATWLLFQNYAPAREQSGACLAGVGVAGWRPDVPNLGRQNRGLPPALNSAFIPPEQVKHGAPMPFDPTQPGAGRARNVLGGPLQVCSSRPLSGFYRNGCCDTGPQDAGLHVVCARMTSEFLDFSVTRGNDLVTPVPEHEFPGLKPGDRWCLCAARWREALQCGMAPPVILAATHEAVLAVVSLEDLKKHALDLQ